MDEVIIGAPYIVDKILIDAQNISVVFCGTEKDVVTEGSIDPYEVPKQLGICSILESPSKVTTTSIIEKIVANSQAFRERNRKKQEKERNAMDANQ